MAVHKDWLPASRNDQLAMAKNWIAVLKEGTPTKATKWGVPAEAVTELTTLAAGAEAALEVDENPETHTVVAVQRCNLAFYNLVEKMRDIKKRYFYIPPLDKGDIASLGLRIPDNSPTYPGGPTAEAYVDTFLAGRHQLGVKIVYESGNPDDKANKGCRIWYTVRAQGEPAPATPKELHDSFFTTKKKDVIDFDFEASGKIAYLAVQVENEGGDKGPWGKIVNALIP
jgi:hypothetical protein